MDCNLSRMYGIRYYSTVSTSRPGSCSSSRETISSPNSSLTESPVPLGICGPLTIFSFIVPAKFEKVSYKEQKQNLKSAIETSPQFQDGLLLDTREKGVLFPIVHLSDNYEFRSNGILEETSLGKDFVLRQGIYQEVRKIVPETELPRVAPFPQAQQHIGYILLGFKSLDRNFSQVMLDTWKDWTGARYIYMYLPDDLGLRRISFYHRQLPDDLELFMYLVVVECHGITNKDKQIRLLDFAQRMRLERMTGYISVYAGEKIEKVKSVSPYEMNGGHEDFLSKNEIDCFYPNGLGPRNTRI